MDVVGIMRKLTQQNDKLFFQASSNKHTFLQRKNKSNIFNHIDVIMVEYFHKRKIPQKK